MKNLVAYSSSESESSEEIDKPRPVKRVKKDDEQPVELKRNQRLPMLLTIEKSEDKDAPENHQMRIRSIPHVEGNWATHVFIECKLLFSPFFPFSTFFLTPGTLNENLKSVITNIEEIFTDIHAISSPHLSLSKTFILRYHWIESFFSSLKDKLKGSTPKFLLQLSSDVVYFSNEDKTRHFACILASEWNQQLLISLVGRVDSCLREFDLPVYYEEPSMHVSILWKLSEFSSEEKAEIESKIKNLMETAQQVLDVVIDKISCKSGNKMVEISL